ncbi:hypothetical protein DP49_5700 [Burkholderia pseudomallei]|nr:hypothetical protein DP49_5700 [Burkholderia pseudomallei]
MPRLKTSLPLLVSVVPVPSVPDVPPLPTCRVPDAIVVAPL